ncbi:MAG: helix-turn-helix domain-containing protein [Deltaproteobacteria bacterium]|jgi:ribosome-binding protein aMBF1 (putative translation factor)|nr:helix-turn-helix domain-containing protein [Deltaproteobacteria bacterium]
MKFNCTAFKKERESRLLSTTALSKMSDVSTSVIRSLESGQRIRPESLRKLISALGFTVSENPFVNCLEKN